MLGHSDQLIWNLGLWAVFVITRDPSAELSSLSGAVQSLDCSYCS